MFWQQADIERIESRDSAVDIQLDVVVAHQRSRYVTRSSAPVALRAGDLLQPSSTIVFSALARIV